MTAGCVPAVSPAGHVDDDRRARSVTSSASEHARRTRHTPISWMPTCTPSGRAREPPVLLRRQRRMRSLLAVRFRLAIVVVLLVGCASPPPPSSRPGTAEPVTASVAPTSDASVVATPAPSQPANAIVSVETRGGECASGLCTRLLNIEADGHIHEVIPKDEVLGTVPVEVVDALQVEVERANYRLLRSRPFTGTCPTAYDGQETIYTFHASRGDQVIESCKVAIDPKHPLFQGVAAVLAGVSP
jgi:hypothetical protein